MRILLVEDDPTTSRSIELMLTHANLNVYCTDMGEEGIDLAKLYDYDLILLDLLLPRLGGLEVVRRLKADPATREIPVIALTAISRQEAFLAGCDDCITKPFDLDHFETTVQSYLAGAGRPRHLQPVE